MEQNMASNAQDIITYMESLRNEEQRKVLMGFFKTAPGEYGYGDEFLGLKVPQTREIVKSVAQDFPLGEIPELLMNRWHEVRLCGFLILVAKYRPTTGTSSTSPRPRSSAIGSSCLRTWAAIPIFPPLAKKTDFRRTTNSRY